MHKFIYENEYGEYEPRKITVEVGQDATVNEMLQSFTDYLKACGYSIPDGDYLEFINDEDVQSVNTWDDFFNQDVDNTIQSGYDSSYKDVTVTFRGEELSDND